MGYDEIVQHLLGRIRAGALPPGARISSEGELVAAFGVSKVTADRALRELARMGAINRVPRVGSFVTEMRSSSILDLPHLAEETRSRGEVHAIEVIELAEENSHPKFALKRRTNYVFPVFRSLIAHRAGTRRTHIEERFVDRKAVPDYLKQDFSKQTTAHYLRQTMANATTEFRIEAVIPERGERDLLRVDRDEPCLLIQENVVNRSGEVISVARTITQLATVIVMR